MKKKVTPKIKSKRIKEARKSITKQPTPNKGGRPREWTEKEIAIETEALINWMKNPKNYFFTNFLIERDLDTAHLDRFAKYNEQFRLAFEKAKKIQECRLVDLAVSRKGDPGFIKFILQNKAGWKEKQELSGDAQNPLSFIMDRIGTNAKNPLDDYYEDE